MKAGSTPRLADGGVDWRYWESEIGSSIFPSFFSLPFLCFVALLMLALKHTHTHKGKYVRNDDIMILIIINIMSHLRKKIAAQEWTESNTDMWVLPRICGTLLIIFQKLRWYLVLFRLRTGKRRTVAMGYTLKIHTGSEFTLWHEYLTYCKKSLFPTSGNGIRILKKKSFKIYIRKKNKNDFSITERMRTFIPLPLAFTTCWFTY